MAVVLGAGKDSSAYQVFVAPTVELGMEKGDVVRAGSTLTVSRGEA
jgi:hypothetical protein